jgi:membrane-bound lytic murein transglycosylase B
MAGLRRAALIGFCLIAASAAEAAPLPTAPYGAWLDALEQEAIASGISPEIVHGALDAAMLDPRVVELDRKQPETTATFADYSRRILSPERIAEGRAALAQNEGVLNGVSQRYGVPPQIILALWGIESHFGRDSGSYEIVDSLATLAYEGRRADFFRGQLLDALRILDRTHMSPADLRGSWAGAMGQCQFMPSTYLKYAVAYDVSGAGGSAGDIWKNRADVFASIANYLAAEDWQAGAGWGREVDPGDQVTSTDIGPDHVMPLADWDARGVRDLDGTPLPGSDITAALIQPDGSDGRSFLVYDNFRALMRWNRSSYFALTVGLFADRIKEF